MGYLRSFWYDFINVYTRDDRLILIMFASCFLPYQCTIAVLLFSFIYIMIKGHPVETVLTMRGSITLLLFGLYCMIVSIGVMNILGVLISIALCMLSVLFAYTRRYIYKELFETIINVVLFLSLLGVIYAAFEQYYYTTQVANMTYFEIQESANFRVHSFYFNANFYCLMILYIEIMCVYKFFIMKSTKWKLYYIGVGLANLFALYLTGGRMAWVALAISSLVMLFLHEVFTHKSYKKFFGYMSAEAIGGLLLLKYPQILPRFQSQGFHTSRRQNIWRTALMMIQDKPVFGRGPLGYLASYKEYTILFQIKYGQELLNLYKKGVRTEHAHSIFLEPLLSFGIVGCIILFIYILQQARQALRLFTRGIDSELGVFIIGMMVATLCFCVVDFPIYWFQCAYVFFVVLGASDVYTKELKL